MEIGIKTLVSIAMIFGMGMVILAVMGEIIGSYKADIKSNLDSNTITNESEASLTNVSTVGCPLVKTGSASAIVNRTGIGEDENWTYVSSTNMSIDELGNVKIYYANIDGNRSRITYSCYVMESYYNTTLKGQTGQIKLVGFMPLVGIVIGALLIISVITMIIVMTKKK